MFLPKNLKVLDITNKLVSADSTAVLKSITPEGIFSGCKLKYASKTIPSLVMANITVDNIPLSIPTNLLVGRITDSNLVWKPVGELNEGDLVCICSGGNLFFNGLVSNISFTPIENEEGFEVDTENNPIWVGSPIDGSIRGFVAILVRDETKIN